MATELESVDVIRERTGVGYDMAKRALDAAEGDLVKALVQAEQWQGQSDDVFGTVGALVRELDELNKQGPVRKVRLRLGDRTVAEVPVFWTALAATCATVGAILISKLSVELERSGSGSPEEQPSDAQG